MTWQRFTDRYAPAGQIRLGAWQVLPSTGDLVECRATIAHADEIVSMRAVATGPVGAMTSILHDLGAPVQIVRLHQRENGGRLTAFLLCEHDDRQAWAYGEGTTCDEANIHALIAGANRLHSLTPA